MLIVAATIDNEEELQLNHHVPLFGYKLVGDNIDKNVRSRYNFTVLTFHIGYHNNY